MYARESGVTVGQTGPKKPGDPDLSALLFTGFALAAGAGMFHAIIWAAKKMANTTDSDLLENVEDDLL